MLTVGIKELKAKLSRYIEQAHGGEEIVVTDHGRKHGLRAFDAVHLSAAMML